MNQQNLVIGKLGDNPLVFRCRPYQEVLSNIAVTLSPSYPINMELHDGETIFDKMNTTYDKFRTTENNIAKVWEYYYELEQKNLMHREWPKPATKFRNLIIRDKNHDHLE